MRNFGRKHWVWWGWFIRRVVSDAGAWSLSASTAIVRPAFLVAILPVVVPLYILSLHPASRADVNAITVNNATDPANTSGNGYCTLREAIDNANSPGVDTTGGDCAVGTGNDTINFSVSGTITLGANGTLPDIENTLTIDGTGQTINVDGALQFQVLFVNSDATLTLNDLTIVHGNSGEASGGGIENLGTLNVTNSTFSSNSAGTSGGGIYNVTTLTVTNSTFSGNNAGGSGGGIYNDGTLTVINSTFSGNSAGGQRRRHP